MILIASACGSTGRAPEGAPEPADRLPARLDDLVGRLQAGGYVILIRHAATDTSIEGAVDLDDCSTQRNLASRGRAQAEDIGAAVEGFDIAIGRVLASPYCRTRQTARIAFGRVATTHALLNIPESASGDRRRQDLVRLLTRFPEGDANDVLVTHVQNIEMATGSIPDEGEGLVVRPRPPDHFRVVGALSPEDWARLAETSRSVADGGKSVSAT